MRNLLLLSSVALGLWIAKRVTPSDQRPGDERCEDIGSSRETLTISEELLRREGSCEEILRSLGLATDKKPPLPAQIDVECLPLYFRGCPHCGVLSMVGENLWRYHELSHTRGESYSATTYLARCKKCDGFMKTKVEYAE